MAVLRLGVSVPKLLLEAASLHNCKNATGENAAPLIVWTCFRCADIFTRRTNDETRRCKEAEIQPAGDSPQGVSTDCQTDRAMRLSRSPRKGRAPRVRPQGRPVELALTPASHVVTPSILLDVLRATRATLHGHAHDLLHVRDRRGAGAVLRDPDMFADEAHHGVEAEVAEAYALGEWAIHLHRGRVHVVRDQAPADAEQALRARKIVAKARQVPPKPGADAFPAAVPEARHGRALNAHAVLQTLLRPSQPTTFARRVLGTSAARRIVQQGDDMFSADRANWPGLCKRLRAPSADSPEARILPVHLR
mmetsp:Transcript_19526/g.39419  ORF Transcript_19526/g.39419 Transcript_19526/m.39419 type:complete len:307 (+) Transcript_19526:67-987(+)